MFKANPSNTFVPSKTQAIKPDSQVPYGRNNNNDLTQVKFLIPQYLGFINPAETYLKYQFQMQGRGQYKPDPRAGFHSLIRDFRIQDGTASTTLEETQDYNVLVANWWGYTENKSISDKRELFEGKSDSSRKDAQLFYGPTGVWANGAVNESPAALAVEALHPLYSGILSSDKVFPVVATQGLRLTYNLDLLNRSLVSNAGDLGEAVAFVQSKFAKAATDDAKVAADSTFNVVIQRPADASSGRGVNRDCLPTNNNPFDIGDILYIADEADGGSEETLGVIVGFNEDADQDLQIDYIPNRPTGGGNGLGALHAIGSRVFYKVADRQRVNTFANVPAANVANNVPIGYQITDLEMVVSVVSPPQQYIQALQNQLKKGMNLDIKCFTNYRVNLTTLNGLTSQLIPATQTRAYSILSVPLNNSRQNNITLSSFRGDTNGQQDYQYVYGGSLIPDRPVAINRYTQNPAKVDALHLIETEKALVNCGYVVRNLQRVEDRFIIARGFSKYGQVFNLMPRDLSLRVNYQGVAGNNQEKLYDHFVCALRRIVIGVNGIQVIM